MTTETASAAFVSDVEVHLSIGDHVDRIPLEKLLEAKDSKTEQVPSVAKLRNVVLSSLVHDTSPSPQSVRLSYMDEDDESILFTSDEELADAIAYSLVFSTSGNGTCDGSTKPLPFLRVKASVTPPHQDQMEKEESDECALSISTINTTTTNPQSEEPSQQQQKDSEEDCLSHLRGILALYHAATCTHAHHKPTNNNNKKDRDASNCPKAMALWTHILLTPRCRQIILHTSQTPPKQATIKSASCRECAPLLQWLQQQKQAIEQNSHPNNEAVLVHNTRDGIQLSGEGVILPPSTNTNTDDAASTTTTTTFLYNEAGDLLDPNFVHARHQCDVCGCCPIVGYRYHAVPIPSTNNNNANRHASSSRRCVEQGQGGEGFPLANFDLCHDCYTRWERHNRFTPPGVHFKPVQYARDDSFTPSPHFFLRNLFRGIFGPSPPCSSAASPRNRSVYPAMHMRHHSRRKVASSSNRGPSYLVGLDTVNEGIRKSLLDLQEKNKLQQKKNQEENGGKEESVLEKSKEDVKDDNLAEKSGDQTKEKQLIDTLEQQTLDEDTNSIQSRSTAASDKDETQNVTVDNMTDYRDEEEEQVVKDNLSESGLSQPDSLSFGPSMVSSISCSIAAMTDEEEGEEEQPTVGVFAVPMDDGSSLSGNSQVITRSADKNNEEQRDKEASSSTSTLSNPSKIVAGEERSGESENSMTRFAAALLSGSIDLNIKENNSGRGSSWLIEASNSGELKNDDDHANNLPSGTSSLTNDDGSYASCFSAKHGSSEGEVSSPPPAVATVSVASSANQESTDKYDDAKSKWTTSDSSSSNNDDDDSGSFLRLSDVESDLDIQSFSSASASKDEDASNLDIQSLSSASASVSKDEHKSPASTGDDDEVDSDFDVQSMSSASASNDEEVVVSSYDHTVDTKTDDHSNDDWDMLDEDDVLGRAAQSIGSVLFDRNM